MDAIKPHIVEAGNPGKEQEGRSSSRVALNTGPGILDVLFLVSLALFMEPEPPDSWSRSLLGS